MSEFLKCDAEGCGHMEDVVEITADMIGKPCPACGSNLLTQEDWDLYSTAIKPALDLMAKLGLSRPAKQDDPDHLKMRVHGHNGHLDIKLPQPLPLPPNPHSEKVDGDAD